MAAFSQKSLDILSTVHSDLQEICKKAILYYDFAVVTGYRNEEEQNRAYKNGFSKLEFPKSKHNKKPSLAVDIYPYPIDFKDIKKFYYLAGLIKGIAIEKGIRIRWGGDWDSDGDFSDNKFNDLAHFELL